MEEKERYEYYVETNQLYDSEEDELYAYNLNNNKVISILNQQDKRIKELEKKYQDLKEDNDATTESLYASRTYLDKNTSKMWELERENQQLKEKLEEKELDIPKLLQVHISKEEIEKLNLLLKQNPMCISIDTTQPTIELMDANKKAIEELRRIKENILINDKYDEEVGCNIIETFDLLEDIRDRIKELSGGENE